VHYPECAEKRADADPAARAQQPRKRSEIENRLADQKEDVVEFSHSNRRQPALPSWIYSALWRIPAEFIRSNALRIQTDSMAIPVEARQKRAPTGSLAKKLGVRF